MKGRSLVLTILLADRDEAIFVYEKLVIQSVTFRYMTVKLLGDSSIFVDCRKNKQACIQKVVIPTLVEMVSQVKEKKMLDKLLQEKFFFTDKMERDEILKIASTVMREGHPMLRNIVFFRQKRIISKALHKFFSEIPNTFSLDAFLQFRLRAYEEYLLKVVECALDEYKLEQEYQSYIDSLRESIKEAKSVTPVIHLHHSKVFKLYDEHMHFISVCTEKEKIIEQLVQLAPQEIHLYTRFIDHPMVVTILNIFQESVKLKHHREFQLVHDD